MTMTTERRRNMRTENCRSCGSLCEPDKGYLYRDMKNKNRFGKFGWFVKCDECHQGNKTRLTVNLEKQIKPETVRPWSAAQVKKWVVDRITHQNDAAIRIGTETFSQIVSYRNRRNSRFEALTDYNLEQTMIAERPLSENAAKYLSEKIRVIEIDIQNEEEQSGQEAIAKLVAAGATVTDCKSGHGWRVRYKDGSYSLWGETQGKNKITGSLDGSFKWISTTVDELLNDSK